MGIYVQESKGADADMTEPTLILTPRRTPDAQVLWRAAIGRGWRVHRLSTWRAAGYDCDQPSPFLYAEAICGEMIAEQLGIRLVNPADDWLPSLPEKYTGRRIQLVSAAEARRMSGWRFVKPANAKGMEAGVRMLPDLPSWLADDDQLVLSDEIEFDTECRCFVLDRQVLAISAYYCRGRLISWLGTWALDRAKAFAEQLLADQSISIPDACVIDVGYIARYGWAVVEMNAAWSSGIYECDPDAVLDVVRAASEKLA